MAWRSFNCIMSKPRLIILDTRSMSSYSAGHIRGSICVKLSSDGKRIERAAGHGRPSWSENCWWDRHVLVVTSDGNSTNRKRKAAELERVNGSSKRTRKATGLLHPVSQFLLKEHLVKSLEVLENDDDDENDEDAFSSFARLYPFLITKSTKASGIRSYPAEIVPGVLYLGDKEHAKDENKLKDLQISHVITIHTEPMKLSKSFVHLFYELADVPTADILPYFEPTYDFIERARNAGGRILVHCGAGASRSATLCAAYLMRARSWGVEDTLKFLKQQRSQVNPNSGFVAALHQYHGDLEHAIGSDQTDPAEMHNSQQLMPRMTVTKACGGDSLKLHLDIVKDGECIGILALIRRGLYFGRAADCDVILDHSSISRKHAMLKDIGRGLAMLSDMGSSHGTFVNGKILPKSSGKILQVGDIVHFGASTRSYILSSEMKHD